MAFNEKPPILRGSEQDQLYALRDYLFRMAQSLGHVESAEVAVSASPIVRQDGSLAYDSGKSARDQAEALRKKAAELRQLIIKTADEVYVYMDKKIEEYNGEYGASSVFGDLLEQYRATIETMASGVVENYDYVSSTTFNALEDKTEDYFTQINGVIRRGFIEDPDNPGNYIVGIAISQNLTFDYEDAEKGVHFESGQTFGFYTSEGWQFWIDGRKVGWFSSLDNMLHVPQFIAEQYVQIGSSWKLFSNASGSEFEIKYVGA